MVEEAALRKGLSQWRRTYQWSHREDEAPVNGMREVQKLIDWGWKRKKRRWWSAKARRQSSLLLNIISIPEEVVSPDALKPGIISANILSEDGTA